MSAQPAEPTEAERRAMLDEYSSLGNHPAVRRRRELERLLGIGRYASDERRSKGG